MDLVGHLSVLVRAGIASTEQAYGSHVIVAMFPNFFHCHEWGYDQLIPERRRLSEHEHLMVRGHLITDWIIHYGDKWTAARSKIGFAYDVMDVAGKRMDAFLDTARARGLLTNPGALNAREPERVRRDFAHTAVECAYEAAIAERYGVDTAVMPLLRSAFTSQLAEGRMNEIRDRLFGDLSGWTNEPVVVQRRSRDEYLAWTQVAESPTDYAALLFASKFGLAQERASIRVVDDLFHRIRSECSDSSFWNCFDTCVDKVANPDRLFA